MNTQFTNKQTDTKNIVRATGHSPLWAFRGNVPQVFVSVSNLRSSQTKQYYSWRRFVRL